MNAMCARNYSRLLIISKDMHSIIAREDKDGQKIFLGIPRYLRGFVDSNKRQETILKDILYKMTHLVNHQNDIILAITKDKKNNKDET